MTLHTQLKNLVKNTPWIYAFYKNIGSMVLTTLGLFVKTDPNQVLFVSYGGQKYDDSPKVVYEYLQSHPEYRHLECVWAFVSPQAHETNSRKVKIDTPAFYLEALRSGYWITNSSVSRGLSFKKKAIKYYLFQHGMAGIKLIGSDIPHSNQTFHSDKQEPFDLIFVEGSQEVDILARVWDYPKERFRITGLPRNDELPLLTYQRIQELRSQLGIPFDKKVILYAPTYREYRKDASRNSILELPFTFSKWRERLGADYVLLVTAHYEVSKLLGDLPEDGFVINAFQHPRINDLLAVADVLITDFSSVCWDYSILARPIFCYAADYDRYMAERGTYINLEQLFSHGVFRNEDSLIESIRNMDYEAECRYTADKIRDRYLAAYGNSADRAVSEIWGSSLEHKEY